MRSRSNVWISVTTGCRFGGGVLIDREVADAEERELERARDRRGRQRERVDLGAHLPQPLFHRDAEPLLLVDRRAGRGRLNSTFFAGEPLRPDHDVDVAALHPGEDFLLLGGRDEPRQLGDFDWKAAQPFGERLEVLEREDRRRDEHGDLLAVLHGLERGADRRSPSCRSRRRRRRAGPSGSAAPCPPSRRSAARRLVGRVLPLEGRLHLALPHRVRREAVARELAFRFA